MKIGNLNISEWIFLIHIVLFGAAWCTFYIKAAMVVLKLPMLEKENPTVPEKFPKLSIIITACNESESIEHAVSTLLHQKYPSLELILINDRSTDGTGKIIEKIAKQDPRVKSLHINSLPEGWLGKVHALHKGTQIATGEWLLFTDADVFFNNEILSKAIAISIDDQLDHLVLIPKIKSKSFLLETVINAFGYVFMYKTKVDKIGKPDSDAFIGIGAFNLVKKSFLDKTDTFEWLKMEVADDVGLGLMLHRFKAKCKCVTAFQHLSLTWYSTIGDMFRGLEKNIFGVGAQYNFIKMLFIVVSTWAIAFSPVLLITYTKIPYVWFLGLIPFILLIICNIISKFKWKTKFLPSLFVPFGMLIFSLILLRAGILCMLRKGIVWRGTKYPVKELRAGQRIKF